MHDKGNENNLFQLLNEINKELKKYYYTELEKNGISLPIEQLNVLQFINANNGVKQQDIADATGKDKTTITRFLDVMLKKGLILKKDSKIDTRQKIITISKKGKDILNKTIDINNMFNKNIENTLSNKELQNFKKNLKVLLVPFNQESLF
jgi:DNA-binding MarR family transcriptional regulator